MEHSDPMYAWQHVLEFLAPLGRIVGTASHGHSRRRGKRSSADEANAKPRAEFQIIRFPSSTRRTTCHSLTNERQNRENADAMCCTATSRPSSNMFG